MTPDMKEGTMTDPRQTPQARRVYRCLVCQAIFDYDLFPPERVVLFNPDREESGLPCFCPGCKEILDDQAGKGKTPEGS